MNRKIKVLWLCNVAFSNEKSTESGSWLHSMSELLLKSGEVNLSNITHNGDSKSKLIKQEFNTITQWIIPKSKIHNNGLPNFKTIKIIQEIIEEVQPDVIHIWGTESYWGLLYARGFISGNVILEIQGLKFAIAKYFFAGLSLFDIINCISFKEILKPSVSIIGSKFTFYRWGKFEIEMISSAKFISTQSDWVRANIRKINQEAKIIETLLTLRKEFLLAERWEFDKCSTFQIFTSTSSSSISYKGLHVLIDALEILRNEFPNVKLNIAGNLVKGIKMDGYSKWLLNKIKSKNLLSNVNWLGPLNADNIIEQMQKSNVVVVPSFIESYCLALEEALYCGVPSVVSFSGAMPELAENNKSAIYFPPGDVEMCANAIRQIFVDKSLAIKLSNEAYNSKRNKHKMENIKSQIEIYKFILNN